MGDDTAIYANDAGLRALRLFHRKVEAMEPLALDRCRREIETYDVLYGPVGFPALLAAYGAGYLTLADAQDIAPSARQVQEAGRMLRQYRPLFVVMAHYAEVMRQLDGVFAYCFSKDGVGAPAAAEHGAFEAVEGQFIGHIRKLDMLDVPAASGLFARVLVAAQDAIEQARAPFSSIQAQAHSRQPYWVRSTQVHPATAMACYFDRMFALPLFRRPVEALASGLKEQAHIDVDTRYKHAAKPLIVAAYPYAEALFYPARAQGGRVLERSPIHKATLAKLERAVSAMDAQYPGKERLERRGMRVPVGQQATAMMPRAQAVAQMMGISEQIFDAVASGVLHGDREQADRPDAAERIAADMLEARLVRSLDEALDFVDAAAAIAKGVLQEQRRAVGRGR